MRSTLWRLGIPVTALGLVSAISSPASADARFAIVAGGHYDGPQTSDPDKRGLEIVRRLATPSATLATTGVDRFGDGESVVRFEQVHRGLPVIGRGAAVRLSAAGQPITTVIDVEDHLPSSTTAAVAPDVAASIASHTADAGRFAIGAGARDAHLVVWPTRDRGARLAYAVVPKVPAGLPTAPRVIVDAMTGEVIEARDMVTFAKARVFESNPAKTPNASNFDFALAPGKQLTNPFVQSSNCIDNKTVKAVNMFGLDMNLHVCDLVQVAKANGTGDFLYEPADQPGSAASKKDEFAEVSMYFHAAKAYGFFRDLQGDPAAQVVVDKPLKVIANLQIPAGVASGNLAAASDPNTPLEPFQNAFFSPAGGGLGALFQQLYGFDQGALWFGQGPQRDYAYDGDVVYHEFTHAVVDATLKLGAWTVDARGAIDAPGAMNEGIADYFSSAITGDPEMGEYAAKDFGSGAGFTRTLANDDKCPTSIIGEVHFDSTLFSGALWQARATLPEADRKKFDATLYKAMRTNPGSADVGFSDLAKLFLATLTTDLPAGASALEASMKARGVLPSCERILEFSGKPLASPEPRFGFAAPGKQAVGLRGTAPGILQVKAALPPHTKSVTVTFKAESGGGGANPLGGQGTPFTPVVLAKLGKPITWNAAAKAAHDADHTVKVEGTSARKATFAIPEGTTADAVFVQIANTGDTDGAYDAIALSFEPGEGAGEGAGPEVAAPPATTTVTESGCAVTSGARAPGFSANGFGVELAGIGAAVGLLLARARRGRR